MNAAMDGGDIIGAENLPDTGGDYFGCFA